jgi:hypothetical protein
VTGGTTLSFTVLGAGSAASVAVAETAAACGTETFVNYALTGTASTTFTVDVPAMDGDFFICVKDPEHCSAAHNKTASGLCGKWHVAGRVRVTTRVSTELTWHVAEGEGIEVVGSDLRGTDMFGIFCGSCTEPQAACAAPKAVVAATEHAGYACDLTMIGDPIYGASVSDCVDTCLQTSGCGGVEVEGSTFCMLKPPCASALSPEPTATFHELPAPTTLLNFQPVSPVPAGNYRACFCDSLRTPDCDQGDLLDIGKVVVSSLTCGQAPAFTCAAQLAGGYRCASM